MKYTKTKTKKMMRVTAGLTLVTLLTVGGLFAKALFAQRDFSGSIRFELCQSDGAGKWRIVDTLEIPSSFSANVAELASGNEFSTQHVWAGTSAKGRKFSAKLGRPSKAAFDPRTGKLELTQMPFEGIIDGQKETVAANLTTESVEGATGSISGKRAQVSNGQASLSMVGSVRLRTDKLAPVGQATIGNKKKIEEFLVVVKANGRLVAR